MPPLEMILKTQHMVVKHLNLETWKYYYVGKKYRGKPSTRRCEDFIGEKAGYISKEAGRLAQNRVLFRDAVRAAHFLKRICDHLFPMLPKNLRSFGTKVVIQRGCLISRFFVIVTNFYSTTLFDIRDDGCGPVA